MAAMEGGVQARKGVPIPGGMALTGQRQMSIVEPSDVELGAIRLACQTLADALARTPLDLLLDQLVERARLLTEADVASLSSVGPAGCEPVRGSGGIRTEQFFRVPVPVGVGVDGSVVATRRPKRVRDYLWDATISHELDGLVADEGIRACMAVPCVLDDQVNATVYVARRSPRPFSREDERRLLQLAADSAVAVCAAIIARRLRSDAADLAGTLRRLAPRESSHGAGALSAREREVLSLIARGHSGKHIARLLGVSDKTVRNHLSNVYRKARIADRAQAVLFALRHGLG
jgi:DNA-binding CsgD family transcriptional regulator